MNNPFTTNEAKLKRQATEAGNAFREALAEQPAQPSKPWVGLTDEEELKLAQDSMGKSRHWLVAQVGAKLREKNT